MPPKTSDVEEIARKLSPLVGLSAWGVRLGYGSFVTLEFGRPVPYDRHPEPVHGEWHLWVTHSAWHLIRESEFVAGSEDPRSHLKEAVQAMEGLALVSIDIAPPTLETCVVLQNQVRLHLFPVYTSEYEHWMIYAPDGTVLIVGPGSDWHWEDGG